MPGGYGALLEDLKARIRAVQVKAALSVNREIVALYWHIGKSIAERQRREKWGDRVIERLARDLSHEFQGIKGFSARNLWRMRSFYLTYGEGVTILPQPAAELPVDFLPQAAAELGDGPLPEVLLQIPWFHNVILIEKVKDPAERLWYARQAVANGWSRNILVMQIETDLYHRQGKAVTNFERTLPPAQSDLAQQVLKDPYVLDFLTLGQEAHERAVENALVEHITRFLLELGAGFAFLGQQHHLEIDDQDFYIDLLFYHTRLHCYVAVELKGGDFRPEDAGKINFYLSALDDLARTPGDNPSVGLILCATKNKVIAEYALRDMTKPIGVSEYLLTRAIPAALRPGLPTVEELEAELGEPG
ncbi:MAG: PDDEXK nuclease domain-containing protein, partial [Methylacidiphilaceae bacterium]|nr:PDDEXK nuclease domain-containing protein [Candidatus Methylacidiphilaceae bacterium]